MKVIVNYELSQKGQRAAILAGITATKKQTIAFDDPENRMIGTTLGNIDKDGVMIININSTPKFAVGHQGSYYGNKYDYVGAKQQLLADIRYKDAHVKVAQDSNAPFFDTLFLSIDDVLAYETSRLSQIAEMQAQADAMNAEFQEAIVKQAAQKAEEERKKAEGEAARKAEEERKKAERAALPPEPDPFEPYLHLDGLTILLKYNKIDQAKRMVLDFKEAELKGKLEQMGLPVFDPADHFAEEDDYDYDFLEDYKKDIPVEAFRALEAALERVKAAGYGGVSYIYFPEEKSDPVLAIHIRVEFAGSKRFVVVKVYEW